VLRDIPVRVLTAGSLSLLLSEPDLRDELSKIEAEPLLDQAVAYRIAAGLESRTSRLPESARRSGQWCEGWPLARGQN
jgi:hypothetical protein